MDDAENDGFVSAADFFRQQQAGPPPPVGKAPEQLVGRKLPRESLLVVARNSQVKNKINVWDRHASGGGGAAGIAAGKAVPPPLGRAAGSGSTATSHGFGRPAQPQGHTSHPHQRRGGTAPSLGAIAEEPAAGPPRRRHAAVVNTATAAGPHWHVASVQTVPLPSTAAAPASPGSKQQAAGERQEACFPSIMFRPLQRLPPTHAVRLGPAPEAAAPLPPPQQPRPLPAVLAPVRMSLSPQMQDPQVEQRQLAAALAAEAAAAASRAAPQQPEEHEEHYLDAESGGASGAASQEGSDGSGVWADARETHLVLHEDDDAASVASDASTVVPNHYLPPPQQSQQLEQWEAHEAEQALREAHVAAGPARSTFSARITQNLDRLFLSASTQPSQGSRMSLGAVPMRRSSLSPLRPAGSRRNSAPGVLPPHAAGGGSSSSLRFSHGGSIVEGLAASSQEWMAPPEEHFSRRAIEEVPPISALSCSPHMAQEEGQEHPSVGPQQPPAAAALSTSSCAMSASVPPLEAASRMCSSSPPATSAPSLTIEYSEASLRYSVDHAPHSPRSHHSRKPQATEPEHSAGPIVAATGATPPQQRFSLGAAASPAAPANTPASPSVLGFAANAVRRTAEERHSLPAPAAAVAEAIQLAAAAAGGDEASRPASLAPSSFPAPAAPPSAALSPAARLGQQAALASLARSPTPASPYAATEYDGDDVVMMDVDNTPRPTAGCRPPLGSSRFQQESLAAAPPASALEQATAQVASGSQAAAASPPPPAAATAEQQGHTPAVDAEAEAAAAAAEPAVQHDMEPPCDTLPCTANSLAQQPLPAAEHDVAEEHRDAAPVVDAAAAAATCIPEGSIHCPLEQSVEAAASALGDLVAPADVMPVLAAEEAAVGASEPVQLPTAQQHSIASTTDSLDSRDSRHPQRFRSSRLSLPTGYRGTAAALHGSKSHRLSLPASMPAAEAGDGDARRAFAPLAKLAMPPVIAAPAPPAAEDEQKGQQHQAAAAPQAEVEPLSLREPQQQPNDQQQQQQQQESTGSPAAEAGAASADAAEAQAVLFSVRRRLEAEDEELPAELQELAPDAAGDEKTGSSAQQVAAEEQQDSPAPQLAAEQPSSPAPQVAGELQPGSPAPQAAGEGQPGSPAPQTAAEQPGSPAPWVAAEEQLGSPASWTAAEEQLLAQPGAAAGTGAAACGEAPAAGEAGTSKRAWELEAEAAVAAAELPVLQQSALQQHSVHEASPCAAVAASAPALAGESAIASEAGAFAARPKLAMSPVLSSATARSSDRSSLSGAAVAPGSDEGTSAFAARPKLAMSPTVSSASVARSVPANLPAREAAEADTADSQPAHEPSAHEQPSHDRPSIAGQPVVAEQPSMAQQPSAAQHGLLAADQPGAAGQPSTPELAEDVEPQIAAVPHGVMQHSPAMSSNPLAGQGNTPAASGRRLSHSPAPSGASAGGISNNPLYAGTPAHPTPPSVNLKSYVGRNGGTPHSAASGGSTPASTGIKLAERLHQVAEQLQNPVAPQGLAALATPSGARLGTASKSPGAHGFEFAADVEALMQALDARTPATAMGQHPALSRAGLGMATTVRRAGVARPQRYSFACTGGNMLLDLDAFDANGDRSAQAGPTPLLRQQVLGGMSAAAAASMGTAPRSGGGSGSASALAAMPAEVRALREEVAALRIQLMESHAERDEMAGLLGGYQSSIKELQDNHSVLVVRLQGENAALKAENEELRRAHKDVDTQFHTLYHDKYLPLKAEAAAMRQELAALQKRVVAEELRAHKAASEANAARQELAAAQERAQGYKAALAEQQAEAGAAREAEQRLQQQLAGEQRRCEKAISAKDAELMELCSRHGTLTKQYDEAVHRINLAKQARERAQLEVQRKEEEVVALEVRLKEYESALREYKKENGKFFEMKERYKAAIAGLEKEVQSKEDDKQQLLNMCNELMTRLEREGVAL